MEATRTGFEDFEPPVAESEMELPPDTDTGVVVHSSHMPRLSGMSFAELAEISPDELRHVGAEALRLMQRPRSTIAGSSGS